MSAHWLIPPRPAPMGSRPAPGVPAIGHTLDPRRCPACGTLQPLALQSPKRAVSRRIAPTGPALQPLALQSPKRSPLYLPVVSTRPMHDRSGVGSGQRLTTTESAPRMPKQRLREDAIEFAAEMAELEASAPQTFADCLAADLGSAERPCPYLRCAHHAMIDVSDRTGSVRIVDVDGDGVPDLTSGPTCTRRIVDVDDATLTLDEVGGVLGMTRERVRQIEGDAMLAARAESLRFCTRDYLTPSIEPVSQWVVNG